MTVLESAFEMPAGRLLGLDLGRARHGVAVSDETGILATPLMVVRRHGTRREDFIALQRLVEAEQAVGVIIGLPSQGPGTSGEQERWTLRYGKRLAGALPVPVAFWDESFSTYDAAAIVGHRREASIDAVAAALILQDYLEARRARPGLENS
jgi:putative Holliday junction resolvase